jgi:hypothetical protein
LKKENRKNDLYDELETMTNEDGRWNLYKKDTTMFNIQKLDEGIKNFLFDISLQTPKDMSNWIEKANKVSMDLFRSSKSYQDEYVESNEMSYRDKIKDIDIMIEHFEEREKYEDCAILVKIKQRIEKRKLLTKIQKNE